MSPVVSAVAFASTLGTSSTPAKADTPLSSTALYAIEGNYVYTAAGAAMRDQGYGTITVTWTGTLVKAYLIWALMDDCATSVENATQCPAPATLGDNLGTINGYNITGVSQGTDASPCWPSSNIFVYASDVTSYVVNGANSLTHFASGDTSGGDPWTDEFVNPAMEGASLVVISTGSSPQQVYIYTGTYTEPYEGNPISSTFNHGSTYASTATTTYIVADGQAGSNYSNTSGGPKLETDPYCSHTYCANYAVWDGTTISENAFSGNDTRASTAPWSQGNLWDTKTFTVPETIGSKSDTAEIGANGGDCITWVAQALQFPSSAPIIGTPQFAGSSMLLLVVAVSMVGLAFLAKKKSSLYNSTS